MTPSDPASSPAETGASPGLRIPPHNVEAEKALLGAILSNNRAFERVSEFLRPEHFTHAANRRVYELAGQMIERGELANPVTLKTHLDHDPALEPVGGVRYLAHLAGSLVSLVNVVDYGRQIHDLALRRELIDLGSNLVNDAFDVSPDLSALDLIGDNESRLYELATQGQQEGGFQAFATALSSAIEVAEIAHRRDGALAGVTTGLRDLDRKLGGLHPSDLIILAGRPSMGKTALATNIAFAAAKAFREEEDPETGVKRTAEGGRVAFFSLEMSAEQLATRILAEQAEINSHSIRTGGLSNSDFDSLVEVSRQLHGLDLYIDDTPALSVAALRTRCRRLARTHGLDMVVIDYLQLLSPGAANRSDSRVQEVSAITRGLKALAKEMNVPVLALSQLSRAVEQREDKRPQLADLRESGSIEQDADVVMFVFREQYYLERAEPGQKSEENLDKFQERHQRWLERCEAAHNIAEVIVAKQRHGPIGPVKLYFDGNFTRFADLAEDGHLPGDLP
ncbi:replicative DNA helicase [Roseospirillum parvum]|uniref:Replicative DNA helicase n=1 Tax=Roseospirillum parvum TaxID=83401 RepID=A0A1G8AZI5_9PROT|nr:replicative DNA helicase [Roseospirillum parvum]SDH26409.1 replicative DNA helicase [Roseospirillum parvum]